MTIISSVTSTQPWQLFSQGTTAMSLLEVPIGESIRYNSDPIDGMGRAEHSDIASVVSDIGTRSLTPRSEFYDFVPVQNGDGTANADGYLLRQGLGAPLYSFDFSSSTIGEESGVSADAQSSGKFLGILEQGIGAAPQQDGGVQASIVNDAQSLIAAGYSRFFVMRPRTVFKGTTALEFGPFPVSVLSSVNIEFRLGSIGALESNDTLEVNLVIDEVSQTIASYAGDIPDTVYSGSHDVTGSEFYLEFVGDLGEGTQEGHVIDYVRIS